ncbi:MAG TPA: Calx-beta domain-containing protein [Thermoanaerobaculia bacterium]|nr:Calx-beta domain-containing protein [Thermoanaerobaculia bacterium]
MRKNRSGSLLRLALLGASLTFALTPAARAAGHNVSATSSATFSPANLTINVGDSVTWTNASGLMHNVTADNGSFRCANGCDGAGGDGTPSGAWTFTKTFNQAATIAYHCEIHGASGGIGMSGTLTVQAASAPGTLGFSSSSFSVPENGGHATIFVGRSGGSSGMVSVSYATNDGSAVAGTHYMAASGSLSWAGGDSSQKSFSVPVLDDGVNDSTHTVNLTLSSPGGGATLGQSTAALAITDTDSPPAPSGTIQFSSAAYSVAENAGSVTITVTRKGGSSGMVGVHYATSDGTGVAGTHYTAASGTLSWGDGDSAAKTFPVPVLDDGVADGNHTVNLTLSAPTGGASLGAPSAAVLTVTNTDGAGTPPAAPSNLAAAGASTTSIRLTWKSNSNNETGFRVQSKVLDGSAFQDVLPLGPAGSTGAIVAGLQPATGYGFRVRAENAAGSSDFTAEADAATDATPAPCVADANTLCLAGRFKTSVAWKTASGSGAGTTVPLASNPDSGLFYFFGPSNIEMLIKVINGCSLSNTYWVFFAATTNVQFTVTVIDTMTGKTRVYFNPLNQSAAPVQDTSAFATCP